MTRRLTLVVGLLALSTSDVTAQRGGSPAAELDIVVKPLRQSGEVSSIEVRAEIRGAIAANRPFSLQAPITYASVRDIADRVDSLVVRDANGAVALTIENDPENRGGFPYFRHWRAARAVVAPVTVTYRMRPFAGVPRGGPQFDLYAPGGGISTGGMALFVVPEGLGNVRLRVRCDLTQLAAGSIAASTYGAGDLDLTGSVDRIIQAYYMAGPLGRYSPAATSGFRAYWLGSRSSMRRKRWPGVIRRTRTCVASIVIPRPQPTTCSCVRFREPLLRWAVRRSRIPSW